MMTQTRYQTIDNLVANVHEKTKKHIGNALKTVTCGLALGIISTFSPGCSSSTGPDYNQTYAPYGVAYDNGRNGAKQVFADDAKLDQFAGALMTGDLTGYSKEAVKSLLRDWVDGSVSNEEIYFGIGITDEGELVNGQQTGTVAFRFGYDKERPSYTSQVTKIPQEKMWEIHEVFPPYQ